MPLVTEPTRCIHAAIKIEENDYWVLLNCGHVTRTNDAYKNVGCPLDGGDNRTWTPAEFKREFRKQVS